MNTLDRYLLREIAVPFVVGIGLFFVVVSFAQILKISDSVTGLGVSGGDVLWALLYSFPPLTGLLVPVAGLFATLLAVGRLSSDREVVALCAVGASPYRLLKVPAVVGVLLATVCLYAMVEGEPWGIRGLRNLMSRSAQRTLASGIRIGEFNEWVRDITFLARGEMADGTLTDVMFADRRDPRLPLVITARRGRVRPGERAQDIIFDMQDGSILLYDEQDSSQRLVRFATSQYRIDVGKLVNRKLKTATGAQGLGIFELWDRSRSEEEYSYKNRALYTITLHRKFALPLATLIFALVAVPLASTRAAGARARGFLYSAGIVGAYYYIGRAVELSSRSGGLSPHLAAWVPNAIGLVALIILLIRYRRSAV